MILHVFGLTYPSQNQAHFGKSRCKFKSAASVLLVVYKTAVDEISTDLNYNTRNAIENLATITFRISNGCALWMLLFKNSLLIYSAILTLTLPDDSEKRESSQPRNTMQENLLQKKK